MKPIPALACVLALSTCAATGFAADPQEHDAHHPASAPQKLKVAANAGQTASADQAARMDRQMRTMREMHDKMMNAKTPEERQALMAEHMKTMRDGMSMMSGMMSSGGSSGKPSASPATAEKKMEMMQKQMDMMQMMMHMMMDRMELTAPAK